jgi:hypothetical protein
MRRESENISVFQSLREAGGHPARRRTKKQIPTIPRQEIKRRSPFRELQNYFGGFLGMGTHMVVVRYDSLKFADNKIMLPGGTKDGL